MKNILPIIFLVVLGSSDGFAQTLIRGAILSVNGQPLPIATVDVTATGPTNVLTLPDKVYANENGEFAINFESPGIYTLIVRGVFHKTLSCQL